MTTDKKKPEGSGSAEGGKTGAAGRDRPEPGRGSGPAGRHDQGGGIPIGMPSDPATLEKMKERARRGDTTGDDEDPEADEG